MRAAHARLVFALGERLHRSATDIEAMSQREVAGWVAHFQRQRIGEDTAAANDGALEMRTLDRATLRAMFHH